VAISNPWARVGSFRGGLFQIRERELCELRGQGMNAVFISLKLTPMDLR